MYVADKLEFTVLKAPSSEGGLVGRKQGDKLKFEAYTSQRAFPRG